MMEMEIRKVWKPQQTKEIKKQRTNEALNEGTNEVRQATLDGNERLKTSGINGCMRLNKKIVDIECRHRVKSSGIAMRISHGHLNGKYRLQIQRNVRD